MLGILWEKLFGNLDLAQLSAIVAAIGFCWSKFMENRARKRGEKEAETEKISGESMEAAIMMVAKDAIDTLAGKADIGKAEGDKLLAEAADSAVSLAKARGVDLEKRLGGQKGVKAAVQHTFKRVKSALRRD